MRIETNGKPLIFLDLETTGTNAATERIVQYCFMKYEQGNPDPIVLQGLLNPEKPIPIEAQEIHHITDEMVQDAPIFEAKAGEFFEFLKNAVYAGYNILQYDLVVLQHEFERAGVMQIDFFKESIIIDSFLLFKRYFKFSLETAYEYHYGMETPFKAHDALSDVETTKAVLQAQIGKYKLPLDAEKISQICLLPSEGFVDFARKFKWDGENQAIIAFGKYEKMKLQDLAVLHRDYLQWMLAKDFPEETLLIVRNALKGVFPIKQDVS
jgi:DNA polymerase-3 subunit epsilon